MFILYVINVCILYQQQWGQGGACSWQLPLMLAQLPEGWRSTSGAVPALSGGMPRGVRAAVPQTYIRCLP